MNTQKLKNPIFLFNTFILMVFVILTVIANGYSEGARQFPKFILSVGVVVIGIWIVIYFFVPSVMRFIEVQEEVEDANEGNPSRYYKGLLCVGGSILVGSLFGFIFLVPTAFLSYGLLLGNRKKIISLIIMTAILMILLYLGFDRVLNVPLRKGMLLDLS